MYVINQGTTTPPTTSSVSASATVVTLLPANPLAKQRTVYNESAATLYLKWGATASVTDYTVQIPPSGYYEFPNAPIYAGLVTGLWSSATGAARLTEAV